MPPPIPDRYRLEIRLGRDGDIEEWLGTDESLDRPVLIRLLGPDSSSERRAEFLEAVRSAARVNHPHLASVFTAGEIPDGAFAVTDWGGGMTLADRLESRDTIDVFEFLPNAAGLASALSGLHENDVVHGKIDAGAIFYAIAHPAKLGAFGRRTDRASVGPADDVAALGRVLEEALTGAPAGGPGPSEIVDGLHPSVDAILRAAQSGTVSARVLAEELLATPSPSPPAVESGGWSRRFMILAAGLVLVALGLIGLGRLLLAGADSALRLPESTQASTPPSSVASTTTAPASGPVVGPVPTTTLLDAVAEATVDPFGGGGENDQRLPELTDGDSSTFWRTETYRDPLSLLKPGVGIVFRVDGSPTQIQLSGFTPGVAYQVAWSTSETPDPATWDVVVRARSAGGFASHQLPLRPGGSWVVWLTDLPRQGDEDHSAQIAEVRFRA